MNSRRKRAFSKFLSYYNYDDDGNGDGDGDGDDASLTFIDLNSSLV